MPERWPFIGRDRVLAEVVAALADADARPTVLAGKPGVGKSGLAREVATWAAANGWTVRRVAATATGRAIPLGAFARWTDDVDGSPAAMARRVCEALTDGVEPDHLLIVVDDAHVLDDMSAFVVHHLAEARAGTVVLTVRSGEPLPAAIASLCHGGAPRRHELAPLTRDDVAALLAAAFDARLDESCTARMWQLTRGNALYVRQLVDHERQAGRMTVHDGVVRWRHGADLPQSLTELVDAHIGAVREDVMDVVDVVSIAEPVTLHCLRTVTDQDAIEEAEQHGLIRVEGDDVYAAHPMFAEVRRSRCGAARLRRLRGEVASTMTGDGSPAQVMKRGLLWLESDLATNPTVLVDAAKAANALLDYEAAVRLSTAASHTPARADALMPLAYSLIMTQRGERASEVLAEVHSAGTAPATFANDVIMRASTLLWTDGAPRRSRRVVKDALDSASGVQRQQLSIFRAYQLVLAARPLEALPIATAIDYRGLDPFATAMGHSAEAMVYAELGQADRAVATAARSARTRDTGGLEAKGLHHAMIESLILALATAGHAAQAILAAQDYCRDQADEPASALLVARQLLGMAHYGAGHLEEALRLFPDGLDDAHDFVVANTFYRFQLLRAQVLARRGNVPAAQRVLDAARVHRHPAYQNLVPAELLTEAWLAAGRHRSTDARTLARRAADLAREHDQLARELLCLQTAVQLDDTDVAGRTAELAERVEGPRAGIVARYAAAVKADRATELDRVSLAFETIGDGLAAADAAGQAATAHRRAGRTGSAMTAAARARRLAAECGGAISPAIAAAGFAPPFSRREHEIAALVAEGLSNRGIAETLGLSLRTVESHVYRACAKAGVLGRVELAALVRSTQP